MARRRGTDRVLAAVVMGASALLAAACLSKASLVPQSFSIDGPAPPAGMGNAKGSVVALARVTVAPEYAGVAFTYRVGEHGVERDPYASFAAPPGALLTAAIREYLLAADFVRDVEQPGGYLSSDATLQITATELHADLGNLAGSAAVLSLHIRVVVPVSGLMPGRELLQKSYSHKTPLAERTAKAAAAGWNADLAEIMKEFLADLKPVLPPARSTS